MRLYIEHLMLVENRVSYFKNITRKKNIAKFTTPIPYKFLVIDNFHEMYK